MAHQKSIAFYEAGSWHHRVKLLQADGTTKYAQKGGFVTAEEAEKSYHQCEEAYKRAYRAHYASPAVNFELKDYLVFWLDEIYSVRVENTSKMLDLPREQITDARKKMRWIRKKMKNYISQVTFICNEPVLIQYSEHRGTD